MIQEIKDIYNYNRDNNRPMLSEYVADFWEPYVLNYANYDRMFVKMYRSWFPMNQTGDLFDIAVDFSEDVKSWLMINHKRYSELFRIQSIVDNEKYSLTDNVYEHEIISKETESSGTNIKGSETITDESETIYGSQSTTEEKEKITGSQTITEDLEKQYGSGTETTENGKSSFNESGWSDTDRSVKTDSSRTDIEDNSITNGSRTDTEDNSIIQAAHTDTYENNRTEGSRTDTTSGEGTEDIERTRSGNIGVMTVDQMLNIHKDVWVDFSFYKLIFEEIARELLRGC